VYRYTSDPRMLAAARRVADYYLSRIGNDWVPNRDFEAPTLHKVYGKERRTRRSCFTARSAFRTAKASMRGSAPATTISSKPLPAGSPRTDPDVLGDGC
jgi:hypothetical protein